MLPTERNQRQRDELRARVRTLLASKPIVVDVSTREAEAMEALLDAVLELVLQNIHDAGGFCDYEWHISGADFSGGFTGADPNICRQCRKPRSEHTLHPILLCDDELALALQLDKDAKRA